MRFVITGGSRILSVIKNNAPHAQTMRGAPKQRRESKPHFTGVLFIIRYFQLITFQNLAGASFWKVTRFWN